MASVKFPWEILINALVIPHRMHRCPSGCGDCKKALAVSNVLSENKYGASKMDNATIEMINQTEIMDILIS
jgi:hypothetical protein